MTRGIIQWFVRNRVAANMLMVVILVAGAVVLPSVRVEVFPEFSTDVVTVSVPYPGAAPEEVEESICRRIEEELQGLAGVKRLRSSAAEGAGAVTVEIERDADVRAVLSDVKVRVDAIDSFPLEAEEPIVQELIPRAQVINVALCGAVEERVLKGLAERVRDDLNALPEITQVSLSTARPYEISIEVGEAELERYGLTFDELARAVRTSSLDLPGGSIDTAGGEILLRTKGQAYIAADFEELVLETRPDGSRLLLGDVATIVDGFAETDQSSRFDGKPAMVLQVFRVGEQNALEVAAAVKAYCQDARAWLPAGVDVSHWRDDSRYLKGRIETLLRNGWQGLALVFLVLMFFLRPQLSFWVTLGIPISFLGALALFPALGVSINVLSLFAFIVVLGIVVDDAIVVGENIYKRQRRGELGERAASEGAREVSVPVIFAVLTSITAFVPMATLAGFTGKIWRIIPMTVIPTLAFSLVESLLILPAHLVHLKPREGRRGLVAAVGRLQGRVSDGLESFVEHIYGPFVERTLRWRYVTLSAAVSVVIVTVGFVAGGGLAFRFFPKLPADDVSARLTMPLGTPSEVTAAAIARVEEAALELAAEYGAEGAVIEHLLASVGEQPWRQAQAQNTGNIGAPAFVGSHLGEVHVALRPSEERDVTSDEIARRWRERVGPIAGAVELVYTSELMSAGKPIDLQLAAADLATLRGAASELREALATYSGVYDVSDSFRAGKREVRLAIRPEGEALGLTQRDLGRQVRQAFYGEEAQRVQRAREEVKVMVRYGEDERSSLAGLEEMRVRLPDGTGVPLFEVADLVFGRGFSTIERTDRRRTLHVTAEVDGSVASAGEVLADVKQRVLPEIGARYPGLSWSLEGEQREQRDTLVGLLRGLVVALLVIYGLMAIPFRSYLQPLIVMTAVPFGMVGAIGGHVITGLSMNVLSLCGLLALAGVVVNDNLVLIDFINRYCAKGGDLVVAVRRAGKARFRPILLTSLTTFAGLTPLMLESSVQALFLIPMAVSLAFGVMFSTLVTLVLTPSLYLILEDLRALVRRVVRWMSEPEPAPEATQAAELVGDADATQIFER